MTTIPHTLGARFQNVRLATMALAAPLSDEDCCVQSMVDASPVKWHLAHTSWFFETFILERFEKDFRPFNASFRVLFNSYYNGIGAKHPRAERGMITRPALSEIKRYRADVDTRLSRLLDASISAAKRATLEQLVTLGLNHEQQHQELILTDLKHLLSLNPSYPAYAADRRAEPPGEAPMEWREMQAGVVEIGHTGGGFCFDNELPRHRQFVEPYALGSRLVTNGEYLKFIEAGGYEDPALWLSDGWAWLHATAKAITHPLYWQRHGTQWHEFTLHGLLPLDKRHAAIHLSYFEADAYARWSKARLPTEFEWECAAAPWADHAGITAAPAEVPLRQLFDTAWQWTSSSYAPYPGYATSAGALGEYNGKFMVNQYVLRGASCATPHGHSRGTYRNFFPASARWQFSAIRLARSL